MTKTCRYNHHDRSWKAVIVVSKQSWKRSVFFAVTAPRHGLVLLMHATPQNKYLRFKNVVPNNQDLELGRHSREKNWAVRDENEFSKVKDKNVSLTIFLLYQDPLVFTRRHFQSSGEAERCFKVWEYCWWVYLLFSSLLSPSLRSIHLASFLLASGPQEPFGYIRMASCCLVCFLLCLLFRVLESWWCCMTKLLHHVCSFHSVFLIVSFWEAILLLLSIMLASNLFGDSKWSMSKMLTSWL